MLCTSDAIVLSLQPYSDKARILHAYTRTGGRVNYKVYGLGKRHAVGLYTPLSLLQITAEFPVSGLPTVREVSVLAQQQANSNQSIYKQTIRLFIAEVLYHVLRHPMADEPMWDYIAEAIQALERSDTPENFHLEFLIGLAAKLGFAMEHQPAMPTTRTERQKVLRALCAYFEEYVETWQTPKSLNILMEVFD